jgi:putative membrane protein
MNKMYWMGAGLCAGLLLSGGAAFAQGSSPTPAKTEHGDAASDREFLTRALRVNRLELELGQMAARRATTPEVKAMGEKMVQKHTEFGQQLSELAQRSGASAAPELSTDQRNTYVRLESLSGRNFDESFKQTVDAGHVDELAMYRDEVSRAVDPQLAALAQRRVATLEQTVAQANPATQAKHKNDW